jgi:tripartite-type tricarboxylate transporter receptor subunit TctC
MLAAALQERLGGTFIVENRPGASSGVGTTFVAQSDPTGHTLLSTTGTSVVINPLMVPDLSYEPDDLRPVAKIMSGTYALMAAKDFEPSSIKDLIAAAKKGPDAVNYGTNGPGTFTALLGALIEQELGIDMLPVPFQGASPAAVALMGGVIDTNIEGVTNGIENIRAGEYTALAVTSPERHPLLPDVPSFAELGYGNIVGQSYHALYAPAETPDNVVQLISDTLGKIMTDPEFVRRIEALGQEPTYESFEVFEKFLTEDRERWAPIVQQLGNN